jgi:DNA-directed RNA polymerase specialized sigma24 family protein
MQRVMRGEPRARRTFSQKQVARVRRIAHALMGPGPESEEAATAALIEMVRAVGSFHGQEPLPQWTCRLAAKSVVRFARALRARAPVTHADGEPQAAQSLEDLLRRLPPDSREVFALVHLFGIPLRETLALVASAEMAVREDLDLARAAYVQLALCGTGLRLPEIAEARQFWSSWDRTAARLDCSTRVRSEEFAALAGLGAWAAALLPHLDGVRAFLDAVGNHRLSSQDRAVLAKAMSGLSAAHGPVGDESSADREDEQASGSDLDGPAWVPPMCLSALALQAVGVVVALLHHEPRTVSPADLPPPVAIRASAPIAGPTIESLPSAVTAARGAPLRRAGVALPPAAPLYERDVLRAAEVPGCFRIEPGTEVCIGAGSEVVLKRLVLGERVLKLVRGRMVIALEAESAPITVDADRARLLATRGTFGLERDDLAVVLRPLLGQADVETPAGTQPLGVGALAVRSGSAERIPLMADKVRRDWELFAAQRVVPAHAVVAKPRAVLEPPMESAPPVDVPGEPQGLSPPAAAPAHPELAPAEGEHADDATEPLADNSLAPEAHAEPAPGP